MSAPKPTEAQTKTPTGTGAESPTTVRPLDMDDDDVQETAALSGNAPTTEQAAPPKPPRPLSPQQQAESTLKEAFPSIDAAVVKAVLRASGGQVEPAFNALLGMSDPDSVVEPTPPVQPPRPSTNRVGSTPQTQLEADEQYARQLAEHYDGSGRGRGGSGYPRQQGQNARSNEAHDEQERNFIDDDLPVIKESLRKGFLQTQSTVNSWITKLKKNMDGEDDDELAYQGQQQGSQAGYGPGGPGAKYGQRRSGDNRRSGDYNRYDADPQVLGDDFGAIQLNDDGTPAQRRSNRPLANPNLFKPTPNLPKSSQENQRTTSSDSAHGSDIYNSSPKATPTSTSKQSKWQPLSTVDPSPMGEGENDPFSLGDSEDEKPEKERVGGKEIKLEDTERLKNAAAKANPEEPTKKLEPAETEGNKDKVAADLTK